MPGLRERKKRATRAAIHDAGMRLFAQQGFTATTIDAIADAADVSRATVFSYYPTKEDIVFGDTPAAIDSLAAALRDRADGQRTIATVQAWLSGLTGWLEPELVLQLRLVREVPVVGARRLQLYGDIERTIADALEHELGPDQQLAARLAAASMMAAMRTTEEVAAARMERQGRELAGDEAAALLGEAAAFAEAGIAAVSGR
jgi:AcrR family transcriptional regulator